MGGLASASGSLNMPFLFSPVITDRKININTIAIEKPNKGENNRAEPILAASPQLTPTFAWFSGNVEKTKPTPNSEPIKVCELEQGMPRYQVPKFQIIAPNNTASIIAAEWLGS